MSRSTVFFLILLRLAIGWHFLFEGLSKVQSTRIGPTVTNKPFSSAGYFREAPGPLGPVVRMALGDPDDEALGRLEIDPAGANLRQQTPPLLRKQWSDYVDRFSGHFGLDERQQQAAEAKLADAEIKAVKWLTDTRAKTEINRSFPTGELKRPMTVPERVADYRAMVEQIRDNQKHKLWAFKKDVEGTKLRQAKAEAAALRNGLLKDLDKHSAELEKQLFTIPKPQQKDRGEVPPSEEVKRQATLDWLTCWGLTVIGACLLVGLFTRINCLFAAGFLLCTYLLVPPFPWLPGVPQNEGTYLFVNKNLIEMLALLVLATTASGKWFGLDGLFAACWWLLRGKHGNA
jgi:uncharacterized membrane protein YphA (DoxX/SURF4 family)